MRWQVQVPTNLLVLVPWGNSSQIQGKYHWNGSPSCSSNPTVLSYLSFCSKLLKNLTSVAPSWLCFSALLNTSICICHTFLPLPGWASMTLTSPAALPPLILPANSRTEMLGWRNERVSVSTPLHSLFCLSWDFMSQTHPESCNPSKSICYCRASSLPIPILYEGGTSLNHHHRV